MKRLRGQHDDIIPSSNSIIREESSTSIPSLPSPSPSGWSSSSTITIIDGMIINTNDELQGYSCDNMTPERSLVHSIYSLSRHDPSLFQCILHDILITLPSSTLSSTCSRLARLGFPVMLPEDYYNDHHNGHDDKSPESDQHDIATNDTHETTITRKDSHHMSNKRAMLMTNARAAVKVPFTFTTSSLQPIRHSKWQELSNGVISLIWSHLTIEERLGNELCCRRWRDLSQLGFGWYSLTGSIMIRIDDFIFFHFLNNHPSRLSRVIDADLLCSSMSLDVVLSSLPLLKRIRLGKRGTRLDLLNILPSSLHTFLSFDIWSPHILQHLKWSRHHENDRFPNLHTMCIAPMTSRRYDVNAQLDDGMSPDQFLPLLLSAIPTLTDLTLESYPLTSIDLIYLSPQSPSPGSASTSTSHARLQRLQTMYLHSAKPSNNMVFPSSLQSLHLICGTSSSSTSALRGIGYQHEKISLQSMKWFDVPLLQSLTIEYPGLGTTATGVVLDELPPTCLQTLTIDCNVNGAFIVPNHQLMSLSLGGQMMSGNAGWSSLPKSLTSLTLSNSIGGGIIRIIMRAAPSLTYLQLRRVDHTNDVMAIVSPILTTLIIQSPLIRKVEAFQSIARNLPSLQRITLIVGHSHWEDDRADGRQNKFDWGRRLSSSSPSSPSSPSSATSVAAKPEAVPLYLEIEEYVPLDHHSNGSDDGSDNDDDEDEEAIQRKIIMRSLICSLLSLEVRRESSTIVITPSLRYINVTIDSGRTKWFSRLQNRFYRILPRITFAGAT
jgi:hypothetical protein